MLDANKPQRFGFRNTESAGRFVVLLAAFLLALLPIAGSAGPASEDACREREPEGAKKSEPKFVSSNDGQSGTSGASMDTTEKANPQVGALRASNRKPEMCPECGGQMEIGLLRSYTYELSWIKGDGSVGKKSGLGYPEVTPRTPVTAYRCAKCGYLKLYAK